MMARSKLNEIIMRGGPRENQGYGNGDNNQMSYNEYQVCPRTITRMVNGFFNFSREYPNIRDIFPELGTYINQQPG